MLVMLFPCMQVLEMRNAMDINDHLILFRSDRIDILLLGMGE